MEQTNRIVNTERGSLFMFDAKNDQLWSFVSTDLERNRIRIPVDHGVTGWVFQNKTPVIINDAYSDPRFFSDVDKQTGFRTRNILCIPIINRKKECIGTLQVLNKKAGEFNEEDVGLLTSASHYVAIALDNAKLYEDLKVLDKAKERVIHHLSHELKTPLAIISSVFKKIHDELKNIDAAELDKTLNRGRRNLQRLMELQEKIDDILKQKSVEEKEKIFDIIQSAADLVWDVRGAYKGRHAYLLEIVSRRLESLFSPDETLKEEIRIGDFLHDLCDRAVSSMRERDLNIIRNFDEDVRLFMHRNVLEKVCGGLLRNAVENTPDRGTIEIAARIENDELLIVVCDYGVGITPQNQQMIFGGFFHTQDTEFYSSKRPYQFNAGGSGSDLLRTKCFSERYGFSINFESTRCRFVPEDRDMCPGKISECKFVTKESECLASGGSTFSIRFPIGGV
jgi:signal transduction histidine kinase